MSRVGTGIEKLSSVLSIACDTFLSPTCFLSSGVDIAMGGGRTYLTRSCRASKLEEPPHLPPRATPVPGLRRESADGTEQLVLTSWVSLTLTEGKFRQVRPTPPASCLTRSAPATLSDACAPLGEPCYTRLTGSALYTQVRKMPAILTMALLLWQVRKMTHAVGHPTLRLVRVRVAQHGQTPSALVVPELGSCTSSGTAWPQIMAALGGSTLLEKGARPLTNWAPSRCLGCSSNSTACGAQVGDVVLGDLRPGELAPWDPGCGLLGRAHAFAESKRGAATLSELLLSAPRAWMHI